jgi:predicted N-formylglutamate amidohydrolase
MADDGTHGNAVADPSQTGARPLRRRRRAGMTAAMPAPVPPVLVHGAARAARWLVTCDHASNRVPPEVAGGDLGVAAADMARHIAWDVGAAGVAVALADALGAPCVLSTFSRLVIDPNRGEDDPTLVMRLYDGTIVPGNARIGADEIARRLATFYRPYHAEIARLAARRADTVIVAVHSFTPCLRGRPRRPWHVGVLYSPRDPRLSRALLARLRAEPDLCVGDNAPYSGHLPGDAIDRHALTPGRHNTLIEVRNDLIAEAGGQRAWGMRLAPLLEGALSDIAG